MPHRCLSCDKIYEDSELDERMTCSCGNSVFLYEKIRSNQAPEETSKLKTRLENFISGLSGEKKKLSFDIETINVPTEGVYELSLHKLFENVPLIIARREGRYQVHLASAFKKGKYDDVILDLPEDE